MSCSHTTAAINPSVLCLPASVPQTRNTVIHAQSSSASILLCCLMNSSIHPPYKNHSPTTHPSEDLFSDFLHLSARALTLTVRSNPSHVFCCLKTETMTASVGPWIGWEYLENSLCHHTSFHRVTDLCVWIRRREGARQYS